MAPPSLVDILRYIGREEPLTGTVRAFPGLTREDLGRLLESAAGRLAALPPEPLPEPRAPVKKPEGPTPAAPPSLRLFSDGAARGNPGPAGAGAVLMDPEGRVVARLGRFLGVQTNNYAEYMGLLLGLKHARSLGVKELEVLADSELLIRQLQGRYQVKSPTLRPLYEEAVGLLKQFLRVKLAHVPREENKAADEMSNRAIDERM
ncbi:ribonuclease HI family protein [Vitiosangium sp. GDMCC 1.1324]|uniref:ribonuclease HI family protein n=1 Tax=Vitiosangium sp. (strain GDMCC 1.1324) TaxID=2138576 RepID=UPI000D3467E2|nr:ribonuclease HI family protein [Vitiosangium sp. GDMCC 1.1324]PTL78492.1 RNase H [Vitiosangium sp. GDMCC 1.1324]